MTEYLTILWSVILKVVEMMLLKYLLKKRDGKYPSRKQVIW
jgi:hypothetical protein